jgi:hypothetical protein
LIIGRSGHPAIEKQKQVVNGEQKTTNRMPRFFPWLDDPVTQ